MVFKEKKTFDYSVLLQYKSLIRNVLSLYPFQKNRLFTVVLVIKTTECGFYYRKF